MAPEAASTPSNAPTLRIGTRGSALALAQTRMVAAMIERTTGMSCELVTVRTEGDDLSIPLSAPPRPGAFAARLRDVLAEGAVDLAVHSFKDLPFAPAEGLRIVAVPPRAAARDALVSASGQGLDALPRGATVGTSSPRRAAALTRRRPDLQIVPIRGNVDTRLRKVRTGVVDAAVIAAAGLDRLGLGEQITELIDPNVLVPAPAQGALAVEMRADHPHADAVAELDDPGSRLRVVAERRVLAVVQATCTTAIGAYCQFSGSSLNLIADLTDHLDVEHAHVELCGALGRDHLLSASMLGEQAAKRLLGRA
ncbi:hydroxymethylbilane synthase [Propionibacterium sp.]|uniref:hydroxymethylbilane synthase n=1 Tax=Propionibacterium sp. TaxID=1977903 RepID=UPI0039E7FF60